MKSHAQNFKKLSDEHEVQQRKLRDHESQGNSMLDKLKIELKTRFEKEKAAYTDAIDKLTLQLTTIEDAHRREL